MKRLPGKHSLRFSVLAACLALLAACAPQARTPAVSEYVSFCSNGVRAAKIDGSDATLLEGTGCPFAWSPDGTRIAFLSNRDDLDNTSPTTWELYTMQADGTDIRRLTDLALSPQQPVWARAGFAPP